MKVIVEEIRSLFPGYKDQENLMRGIVNSKYPISEIVIRDLKKKTATLAETYAVSTKIPLKKFPEEKDKYGKEAKHHQVTEMTKYADALIAIWDGERADIKETIKAMNHQGKPVFLYLVDKKED